MPTPLLNLDEATKYRKLLDLLKTKEFQEYQEMLMGAPSQGSLDYQASNHWYQARLKLLHEILRWVEWMEEGEEDPNVGTDFLHADGTLPEREIRREKR